MQTATGCSLTTRTDNRRGRAAGLVFAAGKIDAQDVPFMAGARFEHNRARIDLSAGGLWRRLKLGNLDAAGTSIDPAAAVHAGLEIRGGLSARAGLVIARHDWRYLTAGLSWQF